MSLITRNTGTNGAPGPGQSPDHPNGHPAAGLAVEARAERLASAATEGTDELVLAMRSDAQELAARGETIDLSVYLQAAQPVSADDSVIDAAIELAFESLEGVGSRSPEEARLELEIRHPELAQEIATTFAMRSMVRGRAPLEVSDGLPRPFGPPDPQGPRYRLLRLVGDGAHGAVYEAVDEFSNAVNAGGTVAVKVISSDVARSGWTLGDAVGAAALGGHGSVLGIRDVGESSRGDRYIATEFATAGSLQTLLDRSSSVTVEHVVRLVRDAATALDAAHKSGLIHGNVKPSNLLLFGDAENPAAVSVRVGDFGAPAGVSLRAAEYESGRLVIDRSIKGGRLRALRDSLLFMAPECRGGQCRPSVASDVYALAATLDYALRFVSGEGRQADDRLRRVLAIAMSAASEQRHATASEFAAELTAWLDGRAIERVDTTIFQKLRLVAKRRPASFFVASLTAVAALSGSVGWVLQSQQQAYTQGTNEVQDAIKSMLAANAITYEQSSALRDWLTATILFDRLHDLGYFDDLPGDRESPDLRAREVRTQLDQLERDQGELGMEGMLLSLELAMHQLRSREPYDDTGDLLAKAAAFFEPILLPGDPFARDIEVMRSVNTVKLSVLENNYQSIELRVAYTQLVDYLKSRSAGMTDPFDDSARRDPIATLALRAVEHLSHPVAYNDPEIRAWCEAQHQDRGEARSTN
ncbi:MAG: protein kinase [Planctomycetota bacterium]